MPVPFPNTGELFEERYRVGPLIGSGGFARVYKARQEDLGRDVALKILTPTLDESEGGFYGHKLADRFEQEARLVSRLRDPNTITMYDYGQSSEGLLYMVFEYINGMSLSALIKREGALAPARVAKILKQILGSLEEAHAFDYLHRDIKPGNIMVFEHVGRRDQVKLLDFGIAKVTDQASTLRGDLTADGALIGTPRYMSPEQIRGDEINQQSDLYSLGLVAYEMVMGEKAIASNSSVTIIGKQLDPVPFSIPDMTGCPEGLRGIINRMLAKDRDVRYANAREAIEALNTWEVEGFSGSPRTLGEEPTDAEPSTRHKDISSELDLNTREFGPGRLSTDKVKTVSRDRPDQEREVVAAPVGDSSRSPASPSKSTASSDPLGSRPLSFSEPVGSAEPADMLDREFRRKESSSSSSQPALNKLLAVAIGVLALLLVSFGMYHVVTDSPALEEPGERASGDAHDEAQLAKLDAPVVEEKAQTIDQAERRMVVRTVPSGRDVWINGRPLGRSPVTLNEASVSFPATVRVADEKGEGQVTEVASYRPEVVVEVTDPNSDARTEEAPMKPVERADSEAGEDDDRPRQDVAPRKPEPKQASQTRSQKPQKKAAQPAEDPKESESKEEEPGKLQLPALDY